MRLGMRRLAPGVLAAIAALSVVLRIGVLLNRRIDPDESQHLHVAWLITQGQVPYRDFWEHHLPFFHYAMAPLTLWLSRATGSLLRRAGRDGALGRRRRVAHVAPRATAVGRRRRVGGRHPRAGPSVRGDVDRDAPRRARARGPPGEPAGPGQLARERPDGVALGGRGVAGRGPGTVAQGGLRARGYPRAGRGAGAERRLGRRPPRSARPVPGRDGARAGRALRRPGPVHGRGHAPRSLPGRGAGLASLRRLRKDLAGVRKRDRRVPGRGARARARPAREGARHPGAPGARPAAPAHPRERVGPLPAPDARGLPARVAAVAAGDGDLRGPGPRHAGGVVAAGADPLEPGAGAGCDRGGRGGPGRARPSSSRSGTRTRAIFA